MYQVGEMIVYGLTGVCRVTEVGKVNIGGKVSEKEFYTLEPVFTKGSVIYTPVDNEKVIIRPVLGKEEAKALIDDIPKIQAIWITDEKQREQIYKDMVKKCDCREWIKVIKTLYLRKVARMEEGKKVTAVDEKYFRLSEEHLYAELSMALGVAREEMREYITERIKHLEEDTLEVLQ